MAILAALLLAPALTRAQQGAEPTPAIVFVLPADLEAETRGSLEEALVSALSLVQVRLVLTRAAEATGPLPIEERVLAAQALAREHAATGVLWLDVRPTDHWFLYAMDADAERVVVRPLLVRSESIAAAIETVAVIARTSTQALLQGEPVAGETVVERVTPPPAAAVPVGPRAPTPPATESAKLRLSVGYVGTTFASALPWQSGVLIGATWSWATGPLVSLNFNWYPSERFGDTLTFSVQRRPFALGAGYALRASQDLRLLGTLAATVDIQSRHTVEVPAGVAAEEDTTRLLFAASPTLAAELDLTGFLGLFLALGADAFINDFDYVAETVGSRTLLAPHRLRVRAAAGIAIIH
jgi:hypothetical protein